MMRNSILLLIATLSMLQGCVAPVVAAGVGVGAGVAANSADRRSTGTIVEDSTIESKSQSRIEEKYKDSVHVNVTAYNRFALITGHVSSDVVKIDIERIVGSIPNVKGIANELVVGPTPTGSPDVSDTHITASLKIRLLKSNAIKVDQVKVLSEGGVVYLLGLVTHAEADAASDIASTTAGVQKVVRVFEYID